MQAGCRDVHLSAARLDDLGISHADGCEDWWWLSAPGSCDGWFVTAAWVGGFAVGLCNPWLEVILLARLQTAVPEAARMVQSEGGGVRGTQPQACSSSARPCSRARLGVLLLLLSTHEHLSLCFCCFLLVYFVWGKSDGAGYARGVELVLWMAEGFPCGAGWAGAGCGARLLHALAQQE